MDLARLPLAPKIVRAAAFAIAALALLELIAYFGWDESAAERNAFGFSSHAGFSEDKSFVSISNAASRQFWTQRYPRIAPAGTARVVLVGDSAARGPSLEGSLSEALRAELARRCGIHAEVWNLSSPGYGSRRKELVVEKALEFHPDLIVYHAAVFTEYEDSREWERYLEYHSWHPRHWVDQLPFLGRVKLAKVERLYWSWLPAEVRAASEEPPLQARIAAITSKTDTRYWTPLMLANLDRTLEDIRQSGIPLLMLVHGFVDATTHKVSDAGLDQVLTDRYGARAGIALVSTREIFAARSDIGVLYRDSSHWTDSGRDLVAAGLGEPACRLLEERRPWPAEPAQRASCGTGCPMVKGKSR
jgi:hypothetical protein